MSKIGKLITIAGIAGAAGAGVYYYLNKKDVSVEVGDEAVSTAAETAKDVASFFAEKKEAIVNSREYVQINKSAKDCKDALTKAVKEAAEVFTEKAKEAEDGVGVVSDESKEAAADYDFKDLNEEANEEENEEKADEGEAE